ncbi:MAG: asparagine synthetase B family protein [Candidatus Helarchaeota archaeon]
MCGITGIFYLKRNKNVEFPILEKMVNILRHRGPDDTGFYINKYIGLGQSRLSIIDIKGGKQPISNEDNTLWLIYNGEIYNYIELREHLKKLGHKFSTKSDTEVIIHSYEEYGFDCLHYFNGQFAFALWDAKKEILFLARDRVGIRPLYYSLMNNETFLFGSEIKSIFKYPQIPREIDPVGVDQIFTTSWTLCSC